MNKSVKYLLASISPLALACALVFVTAGSFDARPSFGIEAFAIAPVSALVDVSPVADLRVETRHQAIASTAVAPRSGSGTSPLTVTSVSFKPATLTAPVRFREPDKPASF